LFLCFLNLFSVKNEGGDLAHWNVASSTGIQRLIFLCLSFASVLVHRIDRLIFFQGWLSKVLLLFLFFLCQKRRWQLRTSSWKRSVIVDRHPIWRRINRRRLIVFCLSFASILAHRPFHCCCFLFFKVDCRRFCCCFYVSLIFFSSKTKAATTCGCIVDRHQNVGSSTVEGWLLLFFCFSFAIAVTIRKKTRSW